MDIFIDTSSRRGLAAQIYDQIRDAIVSGRLRAGDPLTASRDLSAELGVSRHTVTTAYGRLAAEGYIRGRAGGGSVVAAIALPALQSAPPPGALAPRRRFEGWAPAGAPLASAGCRFDLRPGLPDRTLFPQEMWHRRIAAATAGRGASGDPAGELVLRRAIAQWLARSRSVVADESMAVVTSGAQHAVDLVARVLLEPGDTVAVEDPGYPPVVSLLRSLDMNVVGVPVDQHGIVTDGLPPTARMVYLTPSHQLPLGVVLSMERRRALLAWAARQGAAVVEDDYDTEFRYVDRPLEPVQRLDDSGRVIYVGSFSKTLSPALRLGFAIVPPSLAGPVAALRQLTDWHPPIDAQLALAGFIEDGLLEQHLRRTRRIYAQRYRILRDALAGPLAAGLEAIPSGAGLHITAWLRTSASEDEAGGAAREHALLTAAARRGIALAGLSRYYHAGPPRPGLVIGYGAIPAADLPTALEALGESIAR